MSVEEGVQSIVTSGVATGRRSREEFSEEMLDRFERRLAATDVVVGFEELERYAAEASSRIEETARGTIGPSSRRSRSDDGSDGESAGSDDPDSDRASG